MAVTSGDARIRGARFPSGFGPFARLAFGVRRPRRPVLGSSFAGVVEQVGDGVTGVEPGDRVCGMTGVRMGGHAEFLTVAADRVARIPGEVSDDHAAGLLFGGSTAWHFLHDRAAIGPGSSVLVNGASGAVGTNAVQLARHLGATVTGVTSAANAALVRDLGAEELVDHTTTELTSVAERFDVVFDTVGNLSIADGRRLLAPGGTLLLAVAGLGDTVRARGNVVAGSAPERVEHVERLLALVVAGELRVVLDRSLPLADIVEAHRLVDTGRKVGSVVVRP